MHSDFLRLRIVPFFEWNQAKLWFWRKHSNLGNELYSFTCGSSVAGDWDHLTPSEILRSAPQSGWWGTIAIYGGRRKHMTTAHPRNTLTVPRMRPRHTAQLRNAGEQVSQQTRCPQGRNTVFTSRSMQTLHVLASRRRRFSSNSASHSDVFPSTVSRSTTVLRVFLMIIIYRNFCQ